MYLFGASGHGKVVAEIIEANGLKIDAVIDENKTKLYLLDYQVIHSIPEEEIEIVLSVGNNLNRKKIVERFQNFIYRTLIHPCTQISTRTGLGKGTVVMAGVTINAETNIGNHCIINTNAVIEHECEISDFVHIGPNVALAGNISVGEGTQVGIGANIIQGIKIGKWCTIGAGAIIIRDVPDGAVVVGNPGRIIRTENIQ